MNLSLSALCIALVYLSQTTGSVGPTPYTLPSETPSPWLPHRITPNSNPIPMLPLPCQGNSYESVYTRKAFNPFDTRFPHLFAKNLHSKKPAQPPIIYKTSNSMHLLSNKQKWHPCLHRQNSKQPIAIATICAGLTYLAYKYFKRSAPAATSSTAQTPEQTNNTDASTAACSVEQLPDEQNEPACTPAT